MAVYINASSITDCQIQVVEKDGEVHLVRNGHAFVKCVTKRNDLGALDHMVEIWSIDHKQPMVSHSIPCLGWSR